mmetsp:Transcript_19851/g.76063  ORF Transcript_19851/g.76063 Transcript_19851/m.76063 type:complete len:345 (+) Transcript_19851:32-1066(+)
MGGSRVSSFPCSVRSLIHGVSLFLALAVIVACWAGLWQISQHQFYAGNHNECFVTTSAAFYNGDNVLYCPNAHVVSEISLLDFNHLVSAQTFTGVNSYKDLPIVGSVASAPYTTDIYIDDDDQNVWWYFNMNPGSVVSMTFFSVTGEGLQVQVDDEDQYDLVPNEEGQQFVFTTSADDEARGYKMEVYATNQTMMGTWQGQVRFDYNQTYFSDPPDAYNIDEFQCAGLLGANCTWELDWDTDICISMWYPGEHYFGNNWDGQCVEVNQLGRPKWSAVLIPTSVFLLVVIVVANIMVCLVAERLAKRTSNDDPFMEPMDTFTSADERDYDAAKHAKHELSDDESW